MNNPIHKRGRYSREIKVKVAREAMDSTKTIAQIASEYGVSTDAVKDWKRQAQAALQECFSRKGDKAEIARLNARVETLERLLGQREYELDWLIKKGKELGL